MRLSDTELDEIRAAHPLAEVAGRMVTLRKAGRGLVGPCPICSADRTGRAAARFEVKGERWVCAVCCEGGDVIGLVMKAEGRDFRGALEALGEGHRFGRRLTPAEQAEADRKAQAERDRRDAARREEEAAESARRAEEMDRMMAEARRAEAIRPGSIGAQYLAARGLDATGILAAGLRLALHPALSWQGPATPEERRALGAMPTLIAGFRDAAGAVTGFHYTPLSCKGGIWGKASVSLPGRDLPKSIMRGVKLGSSLRLMGPASPRRLILAEGIETALSIVTALIRAGQWGADDAAHAAGDLGNLAGRAAGTVPHPCLTNERGQPRRVPNDVPDCDHPAAPVPDSVEELILCGDGDSERVLTALACARAAARHRRPGRVIRMLMAPDGKDWNDVLREGRRALAEEMA